MDPIELQARLRNREEQTSLYWTLRVSVTVYRLENGKLYLKRILHVYIPYILYKGQKSWVGEIQSTLLISTPYDENSTTIRNLTHNKRLQQSSRVFIPKSILLSNYSTPILCGMKKKQNKTYKIKTNSST